MGAFGLDKAAPQAPLVIGGWEKLSAKARETTPSNLVGRGRDTLFFFDTRTQHSPVEIHVRRIVVLCGAERDPAHARHPRLAGGGGGGVVQSYSRELHGASGERSRPPPVTSARIASKQGRGAEKLDLQELDTCSTATTACTCTQQPAVKYSLAMTDLKK